MSISPSLPPSYASPVPNAAAESPPTPASQIQEPDYIPPNPSPAEKIAEVAKRTLGEHDFNYGGVGPAAVDSDEEIEAGPEDEQANRVGVEQDTKGKAELNAIKDEELRNDFLELAEEGVLHDPNIPERDVRFVNFIDFDTSKLQELNQEYFDTLPDGDRKQFLMACHQLVVDNNRAVYAADTNLGNQRYLLIPIKKNKKDKITVRFLVTYNKRKVDKEKNKIAKPGGTFKDLSRAESGNVKLASLSPKEREADILEGVVEDIHQEIGKILMFKDDPMMKDIPGILKPVVIIQYVSKKDRPKFRLFSEEQNAGNLFRLSHNKNENERLTDSQKLSATKKLLTTLAEFQKRGLVHRDIKGSNILVHKVTKSKPEGEVKLQGGLVPKDSSLMVSITDFGSLLTKEDSPEKYLRTTPNYTSPELASVGMKLAINKDDKAAQESLASNQGHKLDVWSMGLVLYEMWVGKVLPWDHDLFPAPGYEKIVNFNINDLALKELHEKQPEVAKLIVAMLEKDPARRPSALELIKKFPNLFK